jgi:hypothetical protein
MRAFIAITARAARALDAAARDVRLRLVPVVLAIRAGERSLSDLAGPGDVDRLDRSR